MTPLTPSLLRRLRAARPTRQKFRQAFRGADGAIDLASIMVGVLVIGVVGGVIAATVTAVIPWSQDSAAQQNLDSVNTAEGVSLAKDGSFFAYDSHPDAEYHAAEVTYLERPEQRLVIETSDNGQGYVAVTKSASGKIFMRSSTSPEVFVAEDLGYVVASAAGVRSTGVRTFAIPATLGNNLPGGIETERVQEIVTVVAGGSPLVWISQKAGFGAGLNPTAAIFAYGGLTVRSSVDLGSGDLAVRSGNLVIDRNNVTVFGGVRVDGDLTIIGTGRIGGSAQVGGTVTLGSGSVGGNIQADPEIADWVNLTYQPGDWLANGTTPYQVKTASTIADCQLASGPLGGTEPGAPLVLNALGCANGLAISQNTTVQLTGDLVIFANKLNFPAMNALTFASADGSPRLLHLITPDLGAANDGTPTCDPAAQSSLALSNLRISGPIKTLIYTPCGLTTSGQFSMAGKIYAGGVVSLGGSTFSYQPIGAAGVNLN